MINVTKSFLPPIDEYKEKLNSIWDNSWLTNNGPFVIELEEKIKNYLGIEHCFFMGNGTIAIQIALKALNITKEVITTPFSYVATTTSILWENCKPIFVDINQSDFNIDASKIEAAITKDTQAILAVHVYGNPCDVIAIEKIAKKYNLKVIYDAAHAFGVMYQNKSLLSYGDIATCSFHATKVFHTTEGGLITINDNFLKDTIINYRSFGHRGDEYFSLGINGKNSEFHAAMGLCNLKYLKDIIENRKKIVNHYKDELKGLPIQYPIALDNTTPNYSYFPIVLSSEKILMQVRDLLFENGINVRRYFYPSLNQLPYHKGEPCPISEDVSPRVLSLPLYYGLEKENVIRICNIIKIALAE
jgi:dTDP-4-amino-4,6-dideoxygalactose transaminase